MFQWLGSRFFFVKVKGYWEKVALRAGPAGVLGIENLASTKPFLGPMVTPVAEWHPTLWPSCSFRRLASSMVRTTQGLVSQECVNPTFLFARVERFIERMAKVLVRKGKSRLVKRQ